MVVLLLCICGAQHSILWCNPRMLLWYLVHVLPLVLGYVSIICYGGVWDAIPGGLFGVLLWWDVYHGCCGGMSSVAYWCVIPISCMQPLTVPVIWRPVVIRRPRKRLRIRGGGMLA